ncbi:hypothetical protein BGZ65_003375 [Modicella reniformis]|uniref:Uncharacterized protein n=1 Tax=Modicella reniformis TaxID=1440133 RepID=A0A9P6SQ26_9FUNG|nr:hypothetical protein BGZ65_003375 [Modicella reniformis]
MRHRSVNFLPVKKQELLRALVTSYPKNNGNQPGTDLEAAGTVNVAVKFHKFTINKLYNTTNVQAFTALASKGPGKLPKNPGSQATRPLELDSLPDPIKEEAKQIAGKREDEDNCDEDDGDDKDDGDNEDDGDDDDEDEDDKHVFKEGHIRAYGKNFSQLPSSVQPVLCPSAGFSDTFQPFRDRHYPVALE